ncbi:beta-1,3-galactosyltransferase 1-like [Oppia nitens]|uniref:beta-1,3-galactosyltransferase 1-like n=1 Tax=Oppia nitens TaxID=1686743 RepID=UPI0023DA61DA|nr:beta-1,3-galactosyltransferase 1-like [Oppia nitens]
MRPLFIIGLPKTRQTQRELQLEAKQHNDMLQFGFKDDYYNLTLKAISAMGWIVENCNKSDYLVKCDDDVLINVDLLDKIIKNRQFADGITGKMAVTRSNRWTGHKWYMPRDVYTSSYYHFLYGFSYVMTIKSAKQMYKTLSSSNFSEPVLDIDDLFMTGVLAQRSRVRIYHDNRFDYYCHTNVCPLNNMLAIHGCDSVNKTLYIWDKWQKSNDSQCFDRRFPFDVDFGNDFRVSFSINSFRDFVRNISQQFFGQPFTSSNIRLYNYN